MATKPLAFDAAVIQKFAERLYSQAASIIFTSTLVGIVIGAAFGLGGAAVARASETIGTAAIIGAVAGGIAGFLRGKERAFKLKLEAQIALCQVQIEKNTSANKA